MFFNTENPALVIFFDEKNWRVCDDLLLAANVSRIISLRYKQNIYVVN